MQKLSRDVGASSQGRRTSTVGIAVIELPTASCRRLSAMGFQVFGGSRRMNCPCPALMRRASEEVQLVLIGANVEVCITKSGIAKMGHGEIASACGIRATVVSRSERAWVEGEVVSGWVGAASTHDQCRSLPTNFGRLPVSDRMRPRYLAA